MSEAVISKAIRKPLQGIMAAEAQKLSDLFKTFAENMDGRITALANGADEGEPPSMALRRLNAAKAQYVKEYKRLDADIKKWVDAGYPEMYKASQKDAVLDLIDTGRFPREQLRLMLKELDKTNPFHKKAVDRLKEGLYTGNNLKNTVGRRYNDVFRQVGLEISAGVATGSDTWRSAALQEIKTLQGMGLASFQDIRGRHWHLAPYAEMVARTVTMHVVNTGKMNEYLYYGEDLIQISDVSPTCPLCAPWNNAVISITGNSKKYPSFAQAEAAGLWHPSCLHSYSIYFDDSRLAKKQPLPKDTEPLVKTPEMPGIVEAQIIGEPMPAPVPVQTVPKPATVTEMLIDQAQKDLELWNASEYGHVAAGEGTQAVKKALKEITDKHGLKLTAKRRTEILDDIEDYSGSGYKKIRKAQLNWNDSEPLDKAIRLETYIKDAPAFPSDKALYRGEQGLSERSKELFSRLKVGDEYRLGAVSSASSRREIAEDFAASGAFSESPTGGVVLEIVGGTPMGTSIKFASSVAREDEVLLSGGNVFEVLSINTVKTPRNLDQKVVQLRFKKIDAEWLKQVKSRAKNLKLKWE